MDLANIELDRHRTSQLLTFLVIAIGALVLIFSLGQWIGRFQVDNLYWMLIATITAATILGLQRRVWLMVVGGWVYTGGGVFLPLTLREICVLVGTITYVAYRIVSRERTHLRANTLDRIFWFNVAWVLITYAIHPAGFRILGGETMGGRHFFGVMIAVLAYVVVTRLADTPKAVSRIPLIMLAGISFGVLLLTIKYFAPALADSIVWLYAMFDVGAYQVELGADYAMPRAFGRPGGLLMFVMCAYFPALSLFNPLRWRAYAFLLAVIMLLASGYRSGVALVLPATALNAWLRSGWGEVVRVVTVLVVLVFLLLAGQGRFYELPLAAQRALSYLPAQWDPMMQRKKPGLKGIDSRFEWWERIIKEKQIKNWWIGDGYVVSAYDYETLALSASPGAFEEWFTITGGYHNGPLTTIRYVGLVGLVLIYALMITAAVHAVRCVRRSQGTILYPVAMFLAIQLVWKPFHFALLFGAWNSDLPEIIFLAALVRVVTRILDEGKVVSRTKSMTAEPTRRLVGNNTKR